MWLKLRSHCVCCHFFSYRIRVPWPFQWGAPSFDAGEAFAMMMASFVALVEVCEYILPVLLSFEMNWLCCVILIIHLLVLVSFVSGWSLKSTGGFIAVSRYASATMLPPSILSRGIGWQVPCPHTWAYNVAEYTLPRSWADYLLLCGSGSLNSDIRVVWYWCRFLCLYVSIFEMIHVLIWLFPPNISVWKLVIFFLSCSENAGLLALTRVGSRRVVQIAAGFMIFFSILGEFNLNFVQLI